MNFQSVWVWGIFGVVIFQCCQERGKPSQAVFVESETPLFDIDSTQSYRFGYLEVPENRSDPESNTIRLPIYIFKSRSTDPKPDPVIYLVGGPGSSVMNSAPYMEYYSYLDDRDFILFEQRGTQFAKPHLDCPEWSEAVRTANLPGVTKTEGDSILQQGTRNCKNRLEALGIDLNGYNTLESAADVEALRKALGIEKYNLLTLSYGTKIAQTLMRDYPERIRSVVMDSPLPLESSWDMESTQILMETYDKLFSDCASNAICAQHFPDLKPRFYNLLATITENPIEISVTNPGTAEKEIFLLRGKDMIGLLADTNTSDIPNVPLMISHLLEGNYDLIKEQLSALFEPPGKGSGVGMRLSVWCAEETPFISTEEVVRQKNLYPFIAGVSPVLYDPEICDIWGVKAMSPRENMAVKSDIPCLLISGDYDTATPVKWARQMSGNLVNSFHLIFKGFQHTPTTYWSNPCAMNAANTFFNAPDRRPEPACLQTIKKPVFNSE